jgi:hypothetical protein
VTFNFNTQAKLGPLATNPITEKLAILFLAAAVNYTKGYTPNFKDESLFKAQ